MKLPRITIVVPSYNQGHYLDETLRSIFDQEYSNIELFVVDGGSSDNSEEIIGKHEEKINWWTSEKDSGQSEAINKGLKRATGEIITWLNSDDLFAKNALTTIAAHFNASTSNIGLIHGGAEIFNSKKIIETRFTYQAPNKEAYLSGMVLPQPASFFKKKFLDKTGLINEELHYGMDYDLFLRLSLVSEFKPINDVLARYRLHEQSKSVSESNRFIYDWKRSFVNLCKNLEWASEIDYLKKTSLFDQELDYFKAYTFQPEKSIINIINKQKTIFFHLGHVLKDLYWNNDLDKAKDLDDLLRKDFNKTWWEEDPRLKVVSSKLRYPRIALNTLKKIKRIIRKN